MFRYVPIVFFLIANAHLCNANSDLNNEIYLDCTVEEVQSIASGTNIEFKHSPARIKFFKKHKLKKENFNKVTAAIMAFPIPFGIVGLHRINLGTKPYVPVIYIATVGGCFGVLPLIDFFVILFDKNSDNFVNNPHVFMWAK